MQFTFGIITNNNEKNVNLIIDSIEKQSIPEYEIIVVGIQNINRKNTKCILFDENIHPGWITKKKNTITNNATYENIVYMHDYMILNNDWYRGFIQYGNDFDIIVNKIINTDGTRFRDWILNFDFLNGMYFNVNTTETGVKSPYSWIKHKDSLLGVLGIANNRPTIFLDYEDSGEKWQEFIYISGSYFVCKKYVMEEYKLNESLLHGQGEDVEWSQRVRNKYKFKVNPHSSIQLLKHKGMAAPIIIHH